jgi:enoyl-CoA hydratase/carnithine racemase
MTDQPTVRVRLDARAQGMIAFVTIANEAKLNVLGSALMGSFVQTLETLAMESSLRAVVLAGAGERAFVGGADVDEMAALGGPDAARAFIGLVHAACQAVRDMPVPVIARIGGYCLGAGLELAAACDLRVASESAVFGMPEVRLGIPSVVEAALLPMLVGWGAAREMLLLGGTYDAGAALRMGLVSAIAPAAELDALVEARLTFLLACGPVAIRLQKSLIRAWEDLPLRDAIGAGIDAFAEAYGGDEPRAAMASWLEARAARRAKAAPRSTDA